MLVINSFLIIVDTPVSCFLLTLGYCVNPSSFQFTLLIYVDFILVVCTLFMKVF